MKAEYPENEVQRLAALARMRVMDTDSDPVLDCLTQMAAEVFDVPISLVSLVDADRQWFMSRVGLDATETSRDLAFCAHAIHGEAPLVVPDATKDARFSDNPLVTADPNIRFYAGVPLHGHERQRVGTLCVIDSKPRPLEPSDVSALRRIGYLAEERLMSISRLRNLEARVAMVDDMQNILAHDLRAPARQIGGLLDILSESVELGSSPVLPLAKRSAARLQSMVDGLHQYLENDGSGPVAAHPLQPLVAETWNEIEHAPEARLILPAPLPSLPGSREALAIIFRHLFHNAVRHSGRDDVAVEVRCEREGAMWRFTVSDDGEGLGTSEPERIFQVYWKRVRDAVDSGSGVGLTIVRRFVLDIGGTIGAHTNDHGGLSVVFTWPALPSDWPTGARS